MFDTEYAGWSGLAMAVGMALVLFRSRLPLSLKVGMPCFYVASLVLGLLLTWAVPALSEDMGVTELSDVHNVICGSVAAVYVAVLYVLLRRWERESGLSYS